MGVKSIMNRRYDLDWIRDITVISIIFFHSLIIFFTRESAVMYVRSGVNLKFCIYGEAVLSRISMPILFILAGYSIKKSLEKRTVKEVISNRVRKLLFPFLIVSLTLNPLTSYIYGITQRRAITYCSHWLKFVTSISKDFEGRTTGYSPMHLWFILYLFIYSMICLPLFSKLDSSAWQKRFERIAEILSRPYCLLLLVIPYPFIFFIEIMDEMNPIGYLYLFLTGYLLATSEKYQKALERDRWGYLFLAVLTIMVALYAWFVYDGDGNWFLPFCNKASRMCAPMAVIGWGGVLISNRKCKVLEYLNKANYPIYLYHMAVLTVIGYLILKVKTASVLQFVLINIISYGICFMLYEIYRRAIKN